MPMFLTGCDRNAHMKIWLRVNCFDLCKSSYFTYMKKTHKIDVIRRMMHMAVFEDRIVKIVLLL